MGDQQRKALEVDLAWLGGFIDGEGSLLLRRHGGTATKALDIDLYYPGITICNTHEGTLEIVLGIIRDSDLPCHISRRIPSTPRALPSWALEVRGLKRCLRWLDVIGPYLRTKRDQAEWMREFIELRLSTGKKAGYSLREQELLTLLRKRLPIRAHRLNACQP